MPNRKKFSLKFPEIEIDNSLKKYLDKPIFQEKVDKANEMLEKFGLPDFEKKKK